MSVRAVLAAVDRHPRHVLLFAVTAGLLLGPLSPAATLAAAAAAAASSPCSRAVARSPSAAVARCAAVSSPLPSSPPPRCSRARASPTCGSRRSRAGRCRACTAGRSRARAVAARAGPRARGRARRSRARGCSAVPPTARSRCCGCDGAPGAWPGVGEIVAVAGEVAPLGRFDAYQRRRGAGAAIEVAELRARPASAAAGSPGVVDAVRRRAEAGLGARPARRRGGAAARHGARPGRAARRTTCATTSSAPGLAHVLAVSGQNVMLLATLVLAAGRARRRSRCARGCSWRSRSSRSTCRSPAPARRSSARA